MEHRTVLGGVDVHAPVHGVAALLKVHRLRQAHEELDGLVVHQVLREIKVEVGGVKGELVDSLGVAREPLLQADPHVLEVVVVLLERLPFGGLRCVDWCGDVCHRCSLASPMDNLPPSILSLRDDVCADCRTRDDQ